MNPTESALLVTVPEAEPIVAPHRARLDSGAIRGVPAHVTILYPFVAPELLTADVMHQLTHLLAATPPFDLTFGSIGWFGTNVAWLRPTPDEPLRRLTATVAKRWPDWPPYGGEVDDPTPHLTIGDHGGTAALIAATTAIEPALPITTRITEVHLFTGSHEPASWHPHTRFTLE